MFVRRIKKEIEMENQNEKKKTHYKGIAITFAIALFSLSIGGYALTDGFSVFSFNFNFLIQEKYETAETNKTIETNPLDDSNNGKNSTNDIKYYEDEGISTKKEASENIASLSFREYVGRWKLHSDLYNARILNCEINIDSVDENNKTITLTYHYSIAPVLAGEDTTGQNTVTVSYKNEKITILYPDENEINDIRKEELFALTTDIFTLEHNELGNIRSCKLAVAEDGNLYATRTETGSYDYEHAICTKIKSVT